MPGSCATTPGDPGDDPRVAVELVPELEGRNRLTAGFRLILAIPQLIVLSLLCIALLVVGVIAFVAVLFIGRWPLGLRGFALGVGRRWLRVQAYVLLLTVVYPPFALS